MAIGGTHWLLKGTIDHYRPSGKTSSANWQLFCPLFPLATSINLLHLANIELIY
jgi:hypothetical protein